MTSWENLKGLHLHNIFSSFLDAGEAQDDFWSILGDCIFRHHVEPRIKLYRPREETCPIPLKCIDVSRTTHTNLDVKLEKRIDDYWNIDGSRDLSDPWTGFTQCTILEEKAPDGYTWSGGRLTRKQLTSRPDHLHRKSTRKDSMRKRWYFPSKENLFFQSQMDESKHLEEIKTWEHPPWYGSDQFKEKVTLIFL